MKTMFAGGVRAVCLALVGGLWIQPAGLHAQEQQEPAKAEKSVVMAPTTLTANLPKETHAQAGVNINTASLSELQMLPGIGERKAEDIITRRDKKKFSRPEELMEVKGIGRGIFKRVKPYVRVSGPTTLAEKVTAGGKGGTKRG